METTVTVALVGGVCAVVAAAISAIVTATVTRKPAHITAAAAARHAEAIAQQTIADGFTKLNAQYEARNRELGEKLDTALTVLRSICEHLGDVENFVRSHGITDLPPRPPEITEFMLDAGVAWPTPDFSVIKGGKL
jgi:hypothetical protein